MTHRFIFFTAIVFLVCVAGLRASPSVYEGFDYSVGSDLLQGQGSDENGGTGFASAWSLSPASNNPGQATISNGLTYPGFSGTGNGLLLNASTNGITSLTRQFASAMSSADNTELWVSFLMRWDGTASSTPGNFVLRLLDRDPSQTGGTGIGITYSTLTSTYRLSKVGGTASVAASQRTPVNGQVDLLVAQILYKAGTDTVNLFVDPTLGTIPTTPDATLNLTMPSLADVTLTTGTASDVNTTWSFDEFRIGNSDADVAPVPEPSAMALVAVCGFGFAAYRLRRRRAVG